MAAFVWRTRLSMEESSSSTWLKLWTMLCPNVCRPTVLLGNGLQVKLLQDDGSGHAQLTLSLLWQPHACSLESKIFPELAILILFFGRNFCRDFFDGVKCPGNLLHGTSTSPRDVVGTCYLLRFIQYFRCFSPLVWACISKSAPSLGLCGPKGTRVPGWGATLKTSWMRAKCFATHTCSWQRCVWGTGLVKRNQCFFC